MPANIHEENGRAAIFVVKEPAWHELGTVLRKPATAAEAIEAACLDWIVVKQPLFVGGECRPVPDRFAVVREDHWKKQKATVFGIVGADYIALQNRDAFKFFDPIVGENAAVYHTAGALGSGERVWMLAKLPDDIRVIGDDITNKYLLLSNSHDGNSAVQIKFTPIRVVCENTLTLALSKGPSLRLAHTRDLRNHLKIAADVLGIVRVKFSELEQSFKAMARVQVSGKALNEYLGQVFPDPVFKGDDARYRRALEQARRDRELSEYFFIHGRGNDFNGVTGTLWAAYNGIAEYVDYARWPKASDARRLESIWFGDGYLMKARAYTAAEKRTSARVT